MTLRETLPFAAAMVLLAAMSSYSAVATMRQGLPAFTVAFFLLSVVAYSSAAHFTAEARR